MDKQQTRQGIFLLWLPILFGASLPRISNSSNKCPLMKS